MHGRKLLQPRAAKVTAFLITILIWRSLYLNTYRTSDTSSSGNPLLCKLLPGANDTLVILKTGSTEIRDRFTVHLSTSLRCYPNYLIFSDHEEEFQGEHIIDALASVDPKILADHTDFDLYRRLQRDGREVLAASELSGTRSKSTQWAGEAENPGWKLDKWKFLPMVNRTFHERPNMSWYIFVEADTYIMWSNLLRYLAVLDPAKEIYTGSIMSIGDVVFAHGGSSFIVSRPAMRRVVQYYASHKQELENFTDDHWAGDCVLGKAFRDSGVKFSDAWPIMQGDYPGIVPYARPDGRPIADPQKRVWCYPIVSYHHLSPEVVSDLWEFEQARISNGTHRDILRHKDVFRHYIMPRMTMSRDDWDNECDQDEGVLETFEECRTRCESIAQCKQFSYAIGGRCKTRVDPRLGKVGLNIQSGWLADRMDRFERDSPSCGDESWILPS